MSLVVENNGRLEPRSAGFEKFLNVDIQQDVLVLTPTRAGLNNEYMLSELVQSVAGLSNTVLNLENAKSLRDPLPGVIIALANGGDLAVCNLCSSARQKFRQMKLDTISQQVDSVEEGVNKLLGNVFVTLDSVKEKLQGAFEEREARLNMPSVPVRIDPEDQKAAAFDKEIIELSFDSEVICLHFIPDKIKESGLVSARLSEELRELAEVITAPTVVDLSKVQTIGADGIGSLIRFVTTMENKGHEVALSGLSESVASKFRLMNLDSYLSIFETKDQAIASLKS